MGGGLIQLVAYGAQDVYLTGNPQITFFKVVYRRHTNFARECIEQVFDGSAALGSSVVCTLSRSGDLVNNIYLTGVLRSSNGNPTAHCGNVLIKTCEVEIGGQRIDKHYSQWLQIYNELHGAYGGYNGKLSNLVADANGTGGFVEHNVHTALMSRYNNGEADIMGETPSRDDDDERKLYVPLRFWFCNNPGLALPLIALQYHEVKIKITFATGATDFLYDNLSDAKLLVDYIYLDTDERRRFAQVSHEYLIEQVQHEGKITATAAGSSANITVNYNHPVKYIAWIVETSAATHTNHFKSLSQLPIYVGNNGTLNDAGSCKLMLNGNDRFEARDMNYFTHVQPMQHFGFVPPDSRIGVYSFANNPKDHQPSGTCNFSRIDSAIWQMKFASATSDGDGTTNDVAGTDSLFMFAVNYNVLRIMSGMGGLAYSN